MDSLFKYHHAEDLLKKATEYSKKYPNECEGWSFLGTYYLYFNDNDSIAKIYFNKTLSICPEQESALTNYAMIYDRRHQYDSALEYYIRALASNPNYEIAYSNLSLNRSYVGDYNLAIRYARAAEKYNHDTNDQINLTVFYYKAGRLTQRDSMLKVLEERRFSRIEKLKKFVGDTL
jgi:tetratricopeptide (TPR) repeat protein